MPRIFTTNSQLTEEDHIFPRGRNAKQQHAIDRRYRKIGPLTEPLQRLGRKLTPGELIVKKMVKGVVDSPWMSMFTKYWFCVHGRKAVLQSAS